MGALLICVYAARLASDISTDRTRLRFIHEHLSPGASCNPGAPDGTDGRPECRRTRNKAAASSSKGTIRRQPIAPQPAERKPQARLKIKLGAYCLAERRFSNRLNVSAGCKASAKPPTRSKSVWRTALRLITKEETGKQQAEVRMQKGGIARVERRRAITHRANDNSV